MSAWLRVSKLVVLVAMLALSVACESSKADSAADEKAESTPAVDEGEAEEDEEAGEEASAEADEDKAESEEQPSEAAESDEAGESAESGEPGAGDESAKRKDIRKLLEITGSAKIGVQVANQVLNQLKMTAPNVPEEFWTEFKKDMSEQGLIDLIVPIYDKHLTHEEVKALIKFFQTPAGKSYVKKLPAITQESQIAGQKWGRDIAMKVQERLKAKGYR